MEDKSHLPGVPPELAFFRLERRGARHRERMIQNSITRYLKHIYLVSDSLPLPTFKLLPGPATSLASLPRQEGRAISTFVILLPASENFFVARVVH